MWVALPVPAVFSPIADTNEELREELGDRIFHPSFAIASEGHGDREHER